MTPIRPVSDEHRHADYAPRSAVLSILRDAGVDETTVAQVSDVLPDATRPKGDVREALDWFRRNADGLKSDIKLAHSSRGNGCTDWMREDDRDFRRELDKHLATLTALTQAPRSCCAEERERCAKIAEDDCRSDLAKDCDYYPEWYRHAQRIAAAIRSNSHD